MVSSNLTSQPAWLDTFVDGVTVAYGFDESGMWFSGDAGAPYPVRTNYDIADTDSVTVIFTFIHSDGCSDQGVCLFRSTNEPYWEWGEDSSRIALNYNCGVPELDGQASSVESDYEMTVGNTYTGKLVYDPSEAGLVTAYLYEGASATGEPVNTISLVKKLPAGAYRIGFSADQDTAELRSYFTYLEISAGPDVLLTRVFRAAHFPRRRREIVSVENPTPTNVQPGEILYDEEENKLYAGQADHSAVSISGVGNLADQTQTTAGVVSDVTGITGAVAVTNIVKISQAAYDALAVKNPATVYIIEG